MFVAGRLPPHGILPVKIHTALLCLFLCAASLLSAPALAEYNSLQPIAQFGIRYDTNRRFELDGSKTEGAQGVLIDLSLPYEHNRELWSATLRPRMVRSFYRQEENADLEDEDYYLLGTANRRFIRSNLAASYGYTNLSLRTSELEDPADPLPGQPPTGNTTIRNFDDNQENFFFFPSWQLQLTPVDAVGLNAGYRDTTYDINRPTNLFDSVSKNAGVFYRHVLNPRHTIGLQGNLSKYDANNDDLVITNESTSNSLSIIYSYSWSDTATLSTNLGWARTKNTVSRPNIEFFPGFFLCDPMLTLCTSESDSDNFVGNISLEVIRETSSFVLSIGQQITPNSNGAQTLRFTISGLYNKKFNERFSGQAGLLMFTQSNVGDSQFDFDRDYVRPTLSLNYKLTRKWALYTRYNYTWNSQKTFETQSSRTTRNHFISAGFRYGGDGWRW